MSTKNTILSEKDFNLLKNIILKFGIIVTFEQLVYLLQDKMSHQAIRNLANKLSANGWLVRIKKGLYAISNLESRGTITIPQFKIAQILVVNSYISFEAALSYHGIFDQMLKIIPSISLKRCPLRNIQGTIYKFIKVNEYLFFGWQEARVGDYVVKIATAEKALLDMLAFHRNIYTIDIVLEKLIEYKSQFDYSKLYEFCSKYSKTVQRIIGFLLDKADIDSTSFYELIKKDKSSSFMSLDSKEFNPKWRLYYHNHFNR